MSGGRLFRAWNALTQRDFHPDSGDKKPPSSLSRALVWTAASLLVLLLGAVAAVLVLNHGRFFDRFDSIGALRNLPIGGTIKLRGTVTYSDSDQLYIQDATGAVRIAFKIPHRIFPAGQVLVVTARKTNRYNRLLGPSSVDLGDEVLAPAGLGALPVAELRSFQTLPSRSMSNTRIQLQGIVRNAKIDDWHLLMTLSLGRNEVVVLLPRSASHVDPATLVDATVTVAGVPEVTYSSNGSPQDARMWVPDEAELVVDSPPPATIPLVSSLQDLATQPGYRDGHRIRIRGVVIVQEETNGEHVTVLSGIPTLVRVISNEALTLSRGTEVEATGFATPGDYAGDIVDAVLQPISSSPGASAGRLPGKVNALPTLISVSAIRSMDNREADRAQSVKLRGVVTYSDSDWHYLFLQDATGGIFVWHVVEPVAAGQKVELEGTTNAGNYAPNITALYVRVLGAGRLPRRWPLPQNRPRLALKTPAGSAWMGSCIRLVSTPSALMGKFTASWRS